MNATDVVNTEYEKLQYMYMDVDTDYFFLFCYTQNRMLRICRSMETYKENICVLKKQETHVFDI